METRILINVNLVIELVLLALVWKPTSALNACQEDTWKELHVSVNAKTENGKTDKLGLVINATPLVKLVKELELAPAHLVLQADS